jgi:diamine N-acetyltransferase
MQNQEEGDVVDIKLEAVTEKNFWDVINLKSTPEQEERFQLFEKYVGSNAFFIALASVKGWVNRAIYDGGTLVGFATHGLDNEHGRYEMVSIMLGHKYQGMGYGKAALKAILEEMEELYGCEEIYLTTSPTNEAAIRVYEKLGFKPTGESFKAFVEEDVYRLDVSRHESVQSEEVK